MTRFHPSLRFVIRPPPRSRLFPYTTLFRSAGEIVRRRAGEVGFQLRQPFEAAVSPADRKSTRLNSSHRCISYAVFCLKKKKNTTSPSQRSAVREPHAVQRAEAGTAAQLRQA